MLISGTRTSGQKGAVAVVYTTTSSPFIGGYRFDVFDTTQPWKAKYSDVTGDDIPDVSSVLNFSNDIAVAPGNAKVLFGAQNSSKLHVYGFDWITGFGSLTAVDPDASVTTEFTNISGICFSQDEEYVAISTGSYGSSIRNTMSVYHWDDGLDGLEYRITESSSLDRVMAAVTSFPFDSELVNESGSDEQFVYAATGKTTADSQNALGYTTESPATLYYTDSLGSPDSSSYIGRRLYPPSQSPVGLNQSSNPENRFVVQVMDNGVLYFTEVASGYRAGLVPSNFGPNFSSTADSVVGGYTAKYAIFDPHGRLIIAQTDTPYLSIWTQNASNGTFTKLDDYSSWAGGEINTLAYDKDQDILFVSSQSSPYITAFRMSNTGFDFKYPDPASVPSASVVRMSLVYDQHWKSFNA
jgi:hypothetical protein